MHAVNVSLTFTAMLFSYSFNKIYLKKFHDQRLSNAEKNLNQNLIDFKKLIAAIMLGGCLLLALLYVQLKYKNNVPISAILISLTLTIVNFRNSRNPIVIGFIKHYMWQREVLPPWLLRLMFDKTAVVVPAQAQESDNSVASTRANRRKTHRLETHTSSLNPHQHILPQESRSLPDVQIREAATSSLLAGAVPSALLPKPVFTTGQHSGVPQALILQAVSPALQQRLVPSALVRQVDPHALLSRAVFLSPIQRTVPLSPLQRTVFLSSLQRGDAHALLPQEVPPVLQPRLASSAKVSKNNSFVQFPEEVLSIQFGAEVSSDINFREVASAVPAALLPKPVLSTILHSTISSTSTIVPTAITPKSRHPREEFQALGQRVEAVRKLPTLVNQPSKRFKKKNQRIQT